jgi:hypothetical protein
MEVTSEHGKEPDLYGTGNFFSDEGTVASGKKIAHGYV